MIHHGDAFCLLDTFDPGSIDACVTDPPYELGFMGKAWDDSGVAFSPDLWRAVRRVMKPGAYVVAFGGTRTFHRMTCAIEDAGFEIRDCLSWLYGSGFPKSLNLPDGRGTALKPAWEPIILARKPLVGTVAGNVEAHGTGAINIDACRIWTADDLGRPQGADMRGGAYFGASQKSELVTTGHDLGRWPANVLLDEDAAAVLDAQSGETGGGAYRVTGEDEGRLDESEYRFKPTAGTVRDFGGASRFYYVAKPSREERDYGCEGLTTHGTRTTVNREPGSAGAQNPRAGAGRGAGAPVYACRKCLLNLQSGSQSVSRCTDGAKHDPVVVGYGEPVRNTHPTVKPVELMRWLVKLVTPPGGTVLDPFMGSGTTGMACRYESREFIGIEREDDYIQIAERRIAAVAPLFNAEAACTR